MKDLNIIKQFDSADKEEFKRPNHFDFMDSKELEKAKFSGVRMNSISEHQELWMEGQRLVSISVHDLNFREHWNKAYAEALGLHEVVTKGN